MNLKAFFVPVAVLLLFASCNQSGEYYAYRQIDQGLWYRDSVQYFSFDSISVNPLSRYKIDIEITHNNTYPYRNLWLLVGNDLRDSVMRYDTVRFFLSDSEGKWYGGSVGGLHQLTIPYKRNVQLDTATLYRFVVEQLMNDDPLKGIEKIGLKISTD